MEKKMNYIYSAFLVAFLLIMGMLSLGESSKKLPLYGDFKEVNRPSFTIQNWLEVKYQDSMQLFLESKFGYRNYFIRTRNQLYYSLFNESKTKSLIIGKNAVLYEEAYLKEFLGIDREPESTIDDYAVKLKQVQDTLERLGKKLLIVTAPGKASFYPDNIPDDWKQLQKQRPRDYDLFTEAYEKHKLNHFNASSWFQQLKKTSKYPLYSASGIHWTQYAETIFLDSLSRQLRSWKYSVPKRNIMSITLASPKLPDNDLEEGMNLVYSLSNEKLAYPNYSFSSKHEKNCSVLLLGDSYLWHIYESGQVNALFENYAYYYYYHDRYSNYEKEKKSANKYTLISDLLASDCIILLTTEPHFSRYHFGFTDDLHQFFFNPEAYAAFQQEVEKVKQDILNNPDWTEMIREKAKKENKSFEQMLQLDALYVVNMNHNK